MKQIFDPLAFYDTMPTNAKSVNYINGDFNPDHKGDYRKGISKTAMEVTDELADDNLPFVDIHDFEANQTFTESVKPGKKDEITEEVNDGE